jgi:transcriptional regulator with XRE-family HTH domain
MGMDDRAVAVAEGLAEGLSIRAIAGRTGIARATVGRLSQREDVRARAAAERRLAGVVEPSAQEIEREAEERARRVREAAAERQRRHRQRERADAEPEPHRDPNAGRVLAVVRGALQPNPEFTVFGAGRSLESETEAAWLIRRAKEREEAIDLPSAENARAVTATGSYGYDSLDLADIARVIRLIGDEVALDERELRTRLASTAPGDTLDLVADCKPD